MRAKIQFKHVGGSSGLPEQIKGPVKQRQMLRMVDQHRPGRILKIFPLAEIQIFQAFHQIDNLGWGDFDAEAAQQPSKKNNIAQEMMLARRRQRGSNHADNLP